MGNLQEQATCSWDDREPNLRCVLGSVTSLLSTWGGTFTQVNYFKTFPAEVSHS